MLVLSCTKPENPSVDTQDKQEEQKPEPEKPEQEDTPPVVDPRAPVLTINKITPTRACIRLDYSFEKVTEFNQSVNVCFSTEPEPTIEDSKFNLPPRSANKGDMMGVVPNLVLDYGKTYYFDSKTYKALSARCMLELI